MAVWQISTVDSDAKPNVPASTAYDGSGQPHIAYYDADTHLIKHAWFSGGSLVIETVGSSAGTHSLSLAFDRLGNPCISYGDGIHVGNLMFAKRTAAGWTTSKVTRGAWGIFGNAGHYSSLAFDHAGNPHIAYIDGSTYATLYYASLNSTTKLWEINKVYAGDSWRTATGFETALVFNDMDRPYIAFIDKNDQPNLMYTFSDDGITWRTSYLDPGIEDVVRAQSGIQLALDSLGYPHFSYCRKNSDEETEVRYIAWGGNNLGWIRESVAMTSTYMENFPVTTSIAIDTHNCPHISFISNNRNLMYATRTAPDTWSLQTVDPAIRAYLPSLAINKDGLPGIVYVNASSEKLSIAQEVN
jgi:hypothetical protein